MTLQGVYAGSCAMREPGVWFDTAGDDAATLSPLLERIADPPFSAILLYPEKAHDIHRAAPARLRRALQIDSVGRIEERRRDRLATGSRPAFLDCG